MPPPPPPPPPTTVPPTTTTAVPPTTTTTVPLTTTTTTAPEVVAEPVMSSDGELPELAPGASQVVHDGQSVNVEVRAEGATDLVVRGDGFEIRLAGGCTPVCPLAVTGEGRQAFTVEQGGLVTVSGSGVQPGSSVSVWLFSDPTLLGELIADAEGHFSGQLRVGAVAVGDHTLQVNTRGVDGLLRTINLGVVVGPVASTLPATGSDITAVVWVLTILVAGGVLVTTVRRRIVE